MTNNCKIRRITVYTSKYGYNIILVAYFFPGNKLQRRLLHKERQWRL